MINRLFSNIKVYIYATITFLIGALAAYAKYLSIKNDHLKNDLEQKERELNTVKESYKESNEAKQEEIKQTENVASAESEKGSVDKEVDDLVKNSYEKEQDVLL